MIVCYAGSVYYVGDDPMFRASSAAGFDVEVGLGWVRVFFGGIFCLVSDVGIDWFAVGLFEVVPCFA